MDSVGLVGRVGVVVSAVYVAAVALRSSTIELKHFTPSEFGPWWPFMDAGLLLALDQFRGEVGEPVYLSKLPGGIGRFSSKESQHYPTPMVKAIDVYTKSGNLHLAYDVARRVGFHGIGLYPDWNNPGLHLDMRADRTAENPALWSAIKTAGGQEYVDIQRALV